MNAPEAHISPTVWENPMGTEGMEFIEFAAPDPDGMGKLFEAMGFRAVARHRHKQVTLYRQGDINFIVNAEPNSSRSALPVSTARQSAPWRFAFKMQKPPTTERKNSVHGASTAATDRWNSTSRPSRALVIR